MNPSPLTLRHLVVNAQEGYSASVFSETRFSETNIVKKKVGGFKYDAKDGYLWFYKDKWHSAETHIHHISQYFAIDLKGFFLMTGKSKPARFDIGGDATIDGFRNAKKIREWKKNKYDENRFLVSVYKQVEKVSHASEIYEAIDMRLREIGFRHNVPEFTTLSLKCIADMASVQDEKTVVYEIKSKADTLKRLKNQLKDYRKYADFIWLVLDPKFKKAIAKRSEELEGIGIMYYKDGGFIVDVEAEQLESEHDKLEMLWGIEKAKILAGLGLHHSAKTSKGTRSDRIRAACLGSKDRINKIAHAVIQSRIKNFADGKRPKGKSANLADGAGTMRLTSLQTVVYGKAFAMQQLANDKEGPMHCNR